VYLLIGHENDPCCRLVTAALRERGHTALTTLNPLAEERLLTWALDTGSSRSVLRWPGAATLDEGTLRGVLVRSPGGPAAAEGWAPDDLAYVQAEMNAALVAWLRALPCPVVNRPTADLWFRPQRSLPEWRAPFERCGLPALAAQITSDIEAARRFAERWDGCVMYAPLTSQTRYPVVDEAQWSKLASLMERIPVCLVEPVADPPTYVTNVDGRIFWSDPAGANVAEQARIERGLHALAALLEVELLQLELRRGVGGLRCAGAHVYPLIDVHAPEDQAGIAAGIVALLGA
jgi:hypothetical protein